MNKPGWEPNDAVGVVNNALFDLGLIMQTSPWLVDGTPADFAEIWISTSEPLGTETILFAELGGKEIQGKMLNPRTVQPGETLDFTLDPARLHAFDAASGRSLRS